ncbi:MAG: DUF87 domain-containing protein [Bacteroidales bacterium]|nr:DUF87 domain-containing protein [Bacteroidales bacterium]
MYELFYSFLIDELLVRYFKQAPIEAGDKYYIMIEDKDLREQFYAALDRSDYIQTEKYSFDDTEGFAINTKEFECPILTVNEKVKVLISECDKNTDGFQTKIRNSVGMSGNPLSEMAVLFILPGNNAIETLLSAGKNLQEGSYPLSAGKITEAIFEKVKDTINKTEKEYLSQHVEKLKSIDDYSALFDFAPLLSILKKPTLQGSFHELGAFEDKEIYDNLFPVTNPKDRVRQNMATYAKVADIMGEAYEEDQRRRLLDLLDPRLTDKIVNQTVDWKELDWHKVRKSMEEHDAKAVLKRPTIKSTLETLILQTGTEKSKITKTYVIVCDPMGSDEVVKAVFNKELKEYTHEGKSQLATTSILYPDTTEFAYDRVGNDKNHHDVFLLRLRTPNIFQQIKTYFSINKRGNIIVNVPDSMDSVKLGDGINEIEYDQLEPVVLDDNSYLTITFDPNSEEEPMVPIEFGNKIVEMHFRYKGDKIPTLSPSQVADLVWGEKEAITHDGELKGTLNCTNKGEIYLQERLRQLVNIEKYMIDECSKHMSIELSEFGNEEDMIDSPIIIPSTINSCYDNMMAFFQENQTTPTLCYPNDELIELYKAYINAVHNYLDNLPSDSLSKEARAVAKLGVVDCVDGSIMLSPFHPLMVAYILQLSASVDQAEYNKKVTEQLSPLFLLPYIYYGEKTMQAINAAQTEDLLTWVAFADVANNAQISGSKSASQLVSDKITDFITHFKYYFPDADCPIRVSAIGMSQSVDLVRGVVDFIVKNITKSDGVQRIEIHEYVDDILQETFLEKLNRHSSRDSIASLFNQYNFNVTDENINEVIRTLFSRVSYFKHTFKTTKKVAEFSHIVFYKIDSGSNYSAMPANQLRTETSLDGLVSIPSTCVDSDKRYLMGFGTRGLKDIESPIYKMAIDMNSLYAGLNHDGLAAYSKGQCTAKVYSFNDSEFLNSVYENATWVTFINPDVDIDFFYKQENLYVVHYVEQHSISAMLESITVTKHIDQYNNLLFNSLQTFKSVIGTSEVFSRKMISYFNCLNGKWLLNIIRKPEFVVREKTSLVATCFVMEYFLRRMKDIIWVPIALDEIMKVTGSVGGSMDGLFTKKDLGIDGSLSDDILMMGLKRENNRLKLYVYPVEVKVLANDSIEHGEDQVSNLYNKVFKEFILQGNTFTRKVYRALLASQFLSNAEKLRANNLISDANYHEISVCRYELLNVKFTIEQKLLEELGNAALVVYSNSTARTLQTTWHHDVAICHIRMMESDCYRIVTNPDTNLLHFVEQSPIEILDPTIEPTDNTQVVTAQQTMPLVVVDADAAEEGDNNDEDTTVVATPIVTPESVNEEQPVEDVSQDAPKEEENEPRIIIKVGTTKNGKEIIFEPNNTDKVTHPNMGIIGTMGTGKTQFARSIIAQFAKEGHHNVGGEPVGMMVFDYKGDYYQDEFLQKVGGEVFTAGFPFNPLKLIVTEKTRYMNLPSVTADRISDSFMKAYGLGQVQASRIKQVIIETYEQFGITRDSQTWGLPLPTMNDVVKNYLEANDARDSVYALFSKLSDYSIFTPDNYKCVSLFEWLDGVKVIDLTIYPEDTKKVIVSLILDLFYEEMRLLGESNTLGRYRELRAMILVDEAHQFLNKDFKAFRNIISEGRMFGVGMILSTQNLSDFKSSKMDYSSFIGSWIIHHVNNISRGEISNIFGSADNNYQGYMDFITNAKKFESICKLGNTIVGIRDLPYFELIQTDERFISPKDENNNNK